MMKKPVKIIAMLILMLSLIPFTAFADVEDYPFDEYEMRIDDGGVQTLEAAGDFEAFPPENGVSLYKEWTVTFSGLATYENINGMVIRKGDSFIPVTIHLNGKQAAVTPVEPYERGATYTLMIFLDNGKSDP